MQIRDAIESDLPIIVAIYNASIPEHLATADTESVTVESRRHWFRDRSPKHHPLWVIEVEGEIGGWLSFQPFYGRPAYRQTAEISIYIAPDRRRQRLGKYLLQQAIEESPRLGLHTLLGFIFAHNQPSLQLFAQYQFQQWGYLPKVAELDGIERDLTILGRSIL